MAVITQTNGVLGANGAVAVASYTLTASDTLAYVAGTGQILELTNTTGGTLTVNIDGAGSTTIQPKGLGQTIDVSAGYNITLTNGQTKTVPLDSISVWLLGTIAVTGAAGVTARLFA